MRLQDLKHQLSSERSPDHTVPGVVPTLRLQLAEVPISCLLNLLAQRPPFPPT